MAESVSNLVQAAAAPGELPPKPVTAQQANPFGRKRNEIPTAEELLANINRALPFSDEAEKGVIDETLTKE